MEIIQDLAESKKNKWVPVQEAADKLQQGEGLLLMLEGSGCANLPELSVEAQEALDRAELAGFTVGISDKGDGVYIWREFPDAPKVSEIDVEEYARLMRSRFTLIQGGKAGIC